jgi:hypothetical protein
LKEVEKNEQKGKNKGQLGFPNNSQSSRVINEDSHINSPLVVKFIRPSSLFATNQHRFMLDAGLLILVCRLITL